MNQPNVFVHVDGVVSAPFCQLGVDVVRAWFAGHCLRTEITTCCNKTGCTCSIDSSIVRKGSAQEKIDFYNTINMMAEGSLYEVNHNL